MRIARMTFCAMTMVALSVAAVHADGKGHGNSSQPATTSHGSSSPRIPATNCCSTDAIVPSGGHGDLSSGLRSRWTNLAQPS